MKPSLRGLMLNSSMAFEIAGVGQASSASISSCVRNSGIVLLLVYYYDKVVIQLMADKRSNPFPQSVIHNESTVK
jgi:hypothetical protein